MNGNGNSWLRYLLEVVAGAVIAIGFYDAEPVNRHSPSFYGYTCPDGITRFNGGTDGC